MIPNKPGVYPGLTFTEYYAIEAINHSTLKTHDPTAAHAKVALLRPAPTSGEMDFGNLAHAAVLEPRRFERDYVAMETWLTETDAGKAARMTFEVARKGRLDKGEVKSSGMQIDRVTVEGKALHAAFDAATVGKVRVGLDEHAKVRGMIRSLQHDSHSVARDLLYGEGDCEIVFVWIDEATGALCKARIDKLAAPAYLGNVIVDLKSAGDASGRAFQKQVTNLDYDSQAAFYGDGVRTLGEKVPDLKADWRFLHVVVETSEPHEVAVYELDDQAISQGRLKYRRWLTQHVECLASGVWPGFANGPEPLALPKYAIDASLRLTE